MSRKWPVPEGPASSENGVDKPPFTCYNKDETCFDIDAIEVAIILDEYFAQANKKYETS